MPAQSRSYELGLKLLLPPYEVERVHSMYPEAHERLLNIITLFLKVTNPRPTWRIIVNALKSPVVGLTALARRVEAAHFPDSGLTGETSRCKSPSCSSKKI